MNFNFYEKYKEFSTTELLKIVRQADQYEPEATAAAQQVLSEREISEDEMLYVDSFFKQERVIHEKRIERENAVRDFFLTFVRPNGGNDLLYANGVVMLIAFQCVYLSYVYYRPGGLFYNCKMCFDTWRALSFLTPVLLAVTVCLMLYRNKWGWMLLFGYCLATFVNAGLDQIFSFIKYKEDYSFPGGRFLIVNLAYILFVVIVSRPKVKVLFGITENMKKTTAIIAVALAALQVMLIYFPAT
ncbi:efflux RND transporter permease subunit [Chitinophaga filiformis]|uniref:efflux RND transporter permease subunit n=1 Tax=Chitinophaga filiformis TaxID=104663 RepID=UPI001F1B5453|nr:efflux RND transporter permease subunit [Chitinophaga filiformis]MCF6405672.1 efflux RND transporter permease subunit [Chitinophaga filiformis]